jgi:hypothetical protein
MYPLINCCENKIILFFLTYLAVRCGFLDRACSTLTIALLHRSAAEPVITVYSISQSINQSIDQSILESYEPNTSLTFGGKTQTSQIIIHLPLLVGNKCMRIAISWYWSVDFGFCFVFVTLTLNTEVDSLSFCLSSGWAWLAVDVGEPASPTHHRLGITWNPYHTYQSPCTSPFWYPTYKRHWVEPSTKLVFSKAAKYCKFS